MPAGVMVVPPFDDAAFVALPGTYREREFYDSGGTKRWQKLRYLYNGLGAAAVAGAVYLVEFDGDPTKNPKVVACDASAANTYEHVAVGLNASADAGFDWYVVEGYCMASCNGDATDLTRGDWLKVTVGTDADAFIEAAAGGDKTANTHAIYCDSTDETDATPTNRLVYLLGTGAVIT